MDLRDVWKSVFATLTVIALAVSLLPSGRQASDALPEPDYVIGGDMIVSYDEPENFNDALHPSVAVSPMGCEYVGTIHVVWDELDEIGGFREIHYSSSEDGGKTWSHDHDDFLTSFSEKGRANYGDAVNPSIAVDHYGTVHVIWAEQSGVDGTWEVMYSRSTDNGRTWTGATAGDLRISQRVGSGNDAMFISPPKLTIGTPPGKAPEIFHAVWSEMDSRQEQEVVHYSRSFDGGSSWTGQEADDKLSIQGTFARSPAIAISGAEANFIHVSWTQEGPAGWDEIFYVLSDSFGDKGTWTEPRPISYIKDDGMIACDVSFAAGAYDDVYAVWKQYPYGKAPETMLYYSGSNNNGQSWMGVERDFPICDFDGNEPFSPSIDVGDKLVQVMWTEVDEKSPKGTMEIHTSWTDAPFSPESWTGLKGDIVLSNGDEWGPADARNVTMQFGYMKEGYWKPVFVWDELNDEPTRGDRVDRSTEIHTEPEAEWTLSISVYGSGSVGLNPDLETYPDGEIVTLTAYPSAGWHFDHWGGDISGSENPYSLLMDNDKSVVAYFVQDQYTLTINIYGSGSVSKNPNQATYTYGQAVTLTATPAFGWRFDHWSGAISGTTNPRSITMYSSYTVNAYFYQNIFNRNLTTGWNLISLPYIQGDTSVATVLSSISGSYSAVKCYDSSDAADPWKSYRPGGTSNDLTNIDHTMAVWIKATAPCTLSVYGNFPSSTVIPLYTGWNFVGYPSQTARLASVTLPGVADIVSVYNPVSPYVTDYTNKALVTMSQGNGYWVHVTADTTWTVAW